MHDANVARAQLLQGQDSAADDRLNDIGNRIMGSTYTSPAPNNISASGTSAPNNTVGMSMFGDNASAPPSIAPSPAPRMSTAVSRAATPPAYVAPTLAPAFELQRSASVKRSAPESPGLNATGGGTNKHIRLGGESMDMVIPSCSAPPEAAPSPLAPPPMIHSHSFPNGHQLPSQHATNIASTLPLTPTPGSQGFTQVPSSATFAPNLGLQSNPAHFPHMPSPLSAMPINSRPPSPTQHYFPPQANPHGLAMATWEEMAAFSQQQRVFAQDTFESGAIDPSMYMPVQQPVTVSRRGSIVDGRLIAGRPGPSALLDNKSISSSAVPTMTSIVSHARRPPSPVDDSGDGDSDSGAEDSGSPKPHMKRRRSSNDGQAGSSNTSGKLVLPPVLISDDIRANLDRILFEFLNRVCSDREYSLLYF